MRPLLALSLLAAAPAPSAATGGANLLDLRFAELLEMEVRSAFKREEQIRDIPANVTIVEREEIERYGWRSFAELLRHVAGFYLLDNTEDRFVGTRGGPWGGCRSWSTAFPSTPRCRRP